MPRCTIFEISATITPPRVIGIRAIPKEPNVDMSIGVGPNQIHFAIFSKGYDWKNMFVPVDGSYEPFGLFDGTTARRLTILAMPPSRVSTQLSNALNQRIRWSLLSITHKKRSIGN